MKKVYKIPAAMYEHYERELKKLTVTDFYNMHMYIMKMELELNVFKIKESEVKKC